MRGLRIAAWAAAACGILVVLEFVIYEAALVAFSHLDTPTCAGADTFCSPDGGGGLTGGAVVVLVGNVVLVVLIAAAVLIAVARAVTRHRTGRGSRTAPDAAARPARSR